MVNLTFGNVIANWWDGVKGPLADAGINTVIGIVVVFCALIFISYVISLFKYISVIEKKLADKKAAKSLPAEAIAQTVTQIAEQEEQNLADDGELVAVISAAIRAYEEAQGDTAVVAGDLVVRSIKKIDKKRWQNA